jgi:NADPH:quinone reductase-like Zn-dependent oxidoreductase
MKAITQKRYGPPDVLCLRDVAKPEPRDNEVLIRVRASSVNAADMDLLRGMFMVRVAAPLRPRNRIPGSDVAGIVETVGKTVTRFKPGDEVFGDLSECGFGAFAEYVCAPADALTSKPVGLTFEEAATIPQAAIIALQGLRDTKSVQPGQHVLVNGAGGGMGTYAVQIAKSFEAEVTAVDSGSKQDMLGSLGADHFIDYAVQDYTAGEQRYDFILDMVGNHTIAEYKRALAPDGTLGLVGGPMRLFLKVHLRGARQSQSQSEGQKLGLVMWKPNRAKDVAFVKELLETSKIVPVIDGSYALGDTAEAFRRLEAGGICGKAVIAIGSEP